MPRSLSTKLLLAALLSLLCALATYLVIYGIGTVFVNRYYMSKNAVAARKAEIYTDLNRFVQNGQVAGNDADALQRFLAGEDYVSISVYTAEELDLQSISRPSAQSPVLQNYVPASHSGISKLYPMRFSDGIYYISITDNSREREDALNRILAFVVAVAVLRSSSRR